MKKEINTASLLKEILQAQKTSGELPPVEKWNPPLCENIEMQISKDGKWSFMNSPIGREKMVRLFSSVLRLDPDGFYYLVTPVEKIKINVVDKPFVIVTYDKEKIDNKETFFFQTNVGDVVPLNSSHPLRVDFSKTTNEPSPYLLVRKNLEGLISRNVFYNFSDQSDSLLSYAREVKKRIKENFDIALEFEPTIFS